jgi:hypothetical protein
MIELQRDRNGFLHATLEIKDGEVLKVQGKGRLRT